MPLAALIIADAPDKLKVLGRSLLEFQMEQAIGAGATHIVALTSRITPPVLAAADRIRRSGATIDLARTVTDAADLLHPDERILLAPADRYVAQSQLRQLAECTRPTILTVPSESDEAAFDILDSGSRSSGFALLDGNTLRATASMLGDWALAPTIMRQLAQQRADRIMALAGSVTPLTDMTAPMVGHSLVHAPVSDMQDGLGQHWLVAPPAALLARVAGDLGVRETLLSAMAIATVAGSMIFAVSGWPIAALALSSLAMTLAGASRALDLRPSGAGSRWLWWATECAGAMALIVCGIQNAVQSAQWGHVVLAVVTVVTLALCRALIGNFPAYWRRFVPDTSSAVAMVFAAVLFGKGALAIGVLAILMTVVMAMGILRGMPRVND